MFDYKKIVKSHEEDVVSDLKKWIEIPSIYDESTIKENMPFGKDVFDALQYIGHLGEAHGFNVDYCDGYCVEISFGEGPIIGIYAHCDVVPVSGEWIHPPFSGEIDDDKMYGRGTSDDKGPAMAAFHALCALKEQDRIKGYQVRLVIGGNEESGSLCLKHYFHDLKKPYPKYGFTPDGEFPLIYGEKGIANYKVEQRLDAPYLISLHGGSAPNCVMDHVICKIRAKADFAKSCKAYFKATDCTYKLENEEEDIYVLEVFGKAAHGSLPQLGINAGLTLLRFLSFYFLDYRLSKISQSYLDGDGTFLGLYKESELLHGTTFNVGLMDYEDGLLTYVVNFRYPESVKVNKVIDKLNSLDLGNHILLSDDKPLLIDPNSPMVKTLLNVYQDETNDTDTQIMTIGGGTYAKESKNTLAFGSHFPSRDDRIHNSNETIHLEDLYLSMAIYAHAIDSLGRLCD